MKRVMKTGGLRALALAAVFALGSGHASAIAILGSFNFTGATGDMDVNPNGDLVYISSGFGESGLIRVDASNPAAMSQTTLGTAGSGAGVAVDPGTGRFATTTGFGGQFQIFNPNNTLHFSTAIPGCGGALAAGGGLFGVSTQCSDHFSIFNQAGGLLFQQALGGVGGQVGHNPATGNFYARVTNNTRVVTPSFATSTIPGVFFIANGATNRLYGGSTATQLQVLDGTTHALLATIALVTGGVPEVSTLLNQIYVIDVGLIKVFNGVTNALLESFALPDGYSPFNLEIADGDDRLYALASKPGNPNALFVLQMASVPEPSTLALILAALFGLGVVARRRSFIGRGNQLRLA